MAYIDEKDIYKLFENGCGIERLHVVKIDELPRVDAVEVVRCCECRHCEVVNNDITFAICKAPPKTLFLPFDIDTRTHFCSYGERKVSE